MNPAKPGSTPVSAPLAFPEDEARAVLLVRALEEADPDGAKLSLRARRAATDAALEAVGDGDPARFLAERAGRILDAHESPLRRPVHLPAALGVVLALGFGLSTNLLGSQRSIHVLWNPVLGLIAWSLAVYLVLLVRWRPAGLSELALRGRAWIERRFAGGAADSPAAARFLAAWGRATVALRLARIRLALHTGAALVTLAALGGMYLRGLVFEYRATWESTFLSADGAALVLRVLLAPALLVREGGLPDLSALQEQGGASAAWWVHSYAWTVVFLVLVPRAAFAVRESRRARSLACAIAIDAGDPYYRRLLAPARGETAVALALPYSRALDARGAEALRELLGDLLGVRARFELLPVVEYGADAAIPAHAAENGSQRTLAVVFPLAQTPEAEVHGRFAAEVKDALAEDEALLVLVDGAGYGASLGARDEQLAERRRTWDRVLASEGIAAVHLDLGELDADEALAQLAAALRT